MELSKFVSCCNDIGEKLREDELVGVPGCKESTDSVACGMMLAVNFES